VFDITEHDSFDRVKNWVKELRKMLGKDIVLCIVGNKIDLEKQRAVSVAEAEQYAESVGAEYYQTSAKRNIGLDNVFLSVTKRKCDGVSG
jgi:Ras-related protein Rab-21